MAYTLPTFTASIDNAFTTTWYDIKAEAADNIMSAVNIWATFQEKGRFKSQRGSELITRSIDYALIDATAITRGVVFEPGTPQSRTMAQWTFRFIGSNIQRSLFDDRANAGQYKIIDYVTDRLNKAQKGLKVKFETRILAAEVTDETGIEWQSLNDIIPVIGNATTGTYGKINRPLTYAAAATDNATQVPATGNTWWGGKYLAGTDNMEVNLENDLTNLWNSVQNNQENPDLIITAKGMLETYEQFATDKGQIVLSDGAASAKLGFTTFMFKGSMMTWSVNMTAKHALILTTDHIDVVYDPGMWFDMTPWKPVPNSTDSFAQILCAGNIVSDELRRHGRLYYA